ncbi:MAG: hypothetical protein IID32_00800 [Planctomycetes bacterium]|nr:hypothetical protein [Planctomycetota bacterium]
MGIIDRVKSLAKRWRDPVGRGEKIDVGPLMLESLESRVLLSAVTDFLRISEVMYNPLGGPNVAANNFEFVEVTNIGLDPLDLRDVSFVKVVTNPGEPIPETVGIEFHFRESEIDVSSVAPGAHILVVENKVVFQTRYSGLSGKIVGQYNGKLSNGGERVKLVEFADAPNEETIISFEYEDRRGWPQAADGAGHSLVPLDSAIHDGKKDTLNWRGNWRASSYIHGSPGEADPVLPDTVLLNEFMAHTDFPQDPAIETNDWVELYNAGGGSVNLEDWYLSDRIDNLDKWAIPTVDLAAGGFISFDEATGQPGFNMSFGLDKAGERLFLSYLPGTDQDRVVDSIKFKGQLNEVSLGRSSDGGKYWMAQTPSRGVTNNKPEPEVVVSRFMYHPKGTDDEFIELYNPTGLEVVLEDNLQLTDGRWRLDGAVEYFFNEPDNTIPSQGKLIVVGFDPDTETARLAIFKARYDTGSTPIVGPWDGNMSNRGERVALERPQDPDDPINNPGVSWVVVDEVIYFDQAPWPTEADGIGSTLDRKKFDQSGNDPANWQANKRPVVGSLTAMPEPVLQQGDMMLTLTAQDVNDVDGVVGKVEFYLDDGDGKFSSSIDELLGTDSDGGDGWSWNLSTAGFPVGTHTYYARAQDDDQVWSIKGKTTGRINAAPVIGSLLADPDPVALGDDLTLTAMGVKDGDGTISQVAFYRDANDNQVLDVGVDELLGTDVVGSDGWNWVGSTSGMAAGENHFFARVQDNDGVWSDAVTTMTTINTPPVVVSVTASPDPVVQGAPLTLQANGVADSDGSVVQVAFYLDSNKNGSLEVGLDIVLGLDESGADGWETVAVTNGFSIGLNQIFARALDDEGAWSTAVSVQVTVTAPPNRFPTIGSLTAAPAVLMQGETLTLTAKSVADSDGSVVRVEFYHDSNGNGLFEAGADTLLGTGTISGDGSSHIEANAGFAPGVHVFFARAQDDKDALGNTVQATIRVNDPPTIDSLTVDPDPIVLGSLLTLTAVDVQDSDGVITKVEFYRDANKNGALDVDVDELLATDTDGSDGWAWQGSTSGFPADSKVFFVRALDNDNTWSRAKDQSALINIAPVVGALSANPNPVGLGRQVALTAEGVVDSDGSIVQVEFYRDLNGNGTLEVGSDFLLVGESNGPDSWEWTGSTKNFLFGANAFFVRALDDQGAWSEVVVASFEVERFNVIAGLPQSRTVRYTDLDGSEVTLKLSKGTARLLFDGTALRTFVRGSTTWILGEPGFSGRAELADVKLLDTSVSSSLTISARGGFDGQTPLGNVTGGSLGKLNGRTVLLKGDIALTGSFGSMVVDDISDEVTVSSGLAHVRGFSLKADQIGNQVWFVIAGTVKRFQATSYREGLLMADSIGQVKIKDQTFGADVIARQGDILGVSTVGDITGHLNASGMIRKISSKRGDFKGVARAGSQIASLSAMNLDGALLSAGETIGRISVKGDILDTHILAGYDVGGDSVFSQDDVFGGGNVVSVSAKGNFIRSYVGAGVLPMSPLTGVALPNEGLPLFEAFGTISKVKFGSIDLDAEVDYGLFAVTEIKPFRIGRSPGTTNGHFLVVP